MRWRSGDAARVEATCIWILFATLILFGAVGCQSGSVSAETAETVTGGARAYQRGAVAADHALGSEAGIEILKLGGNAVDAAVATSFTQAVTRPFSCGLGGGGFMMIHLAGDELEPARNTVIIYREEAPSAVGPDYYVELGIDDASVYGPHASGVPGTVAGLTYALERYGSLDRSVVLAPAIRAAIDGFPIDEAYVEAAETVIALLRERPELRELIGEERVEWLWRRYLFEGGPEVGDILRQPELASTLRMIAEDGDAAFYAGPIASAIAEASATIVEEDLAQFNAQEAPPLTTEFLGHRFLLMPPPSSGGVAILQALEFIERRADALRAMAWNGDSYVHLIVEALKHAFADRAEWMADTRFAEVPIERLTSEPYIDALVLRFDPAKTFDLDYYGSRIEAIEDGGTSHMSIVDRWGNAVAVTETINLEFGALNPVPEYGILLNNEMDDFLTIPGAPNAFGLTQSNRNLPAPGKRPLSSMSPTIVLDENGRVAMVAGASGGPRIITSTLQVMLNLLLFTDDPHAALVAPRFHHQWAPNVLSIEDGWSDAAALDELRRRGHDVVEREDVGVVQVISWVETDDGGGYAPASDPRKGGRAAGW